MWFMMKKTLTLLPLAFLFAFPSLAGATDNTPQGTALPASFYCASAKQIAESYVLLIKEKYAKQAKDQNYFEAQLKYQIAAAKFSGIRSTIELEAVGGSRIPNVNDSRYQSMVIEALKAFDDFSAVSQKIIFSAPNTASTQAVASLDFSTVITDIFSFVSRFQELWVKQDEIRETRLKKLSDWIDQYYKWSNWDDIGKPATTNAS
jgi:hypothetical protein